MKNLAHNIHTNTQYCSRQLVEAAFVLLPKNLFIKIKWCPTVIESVKSVVENYWIDLSEILYKAG